MWLQQSLRWQCSIVRPALQRHDRNCPSVDFCVYFGYFCDAFWSKIGIIVQLKLILCLIHKIVEYFDFWKCWPLTDKKHSDLHNSPWSILIALTRCGTKIRRNLVESAKDQPKIVKAIWRETSEFCAYTHNRVEFARWTILTMGLNADDWVNVAKKELRRTSMPAGMFVGLFGMEPGLVSILWRLVNKDGQRREPKHLLWAMCFLKTYSLS